MLVILAALDSSARAASLGVSPTLINMHATQMASGVRVRNMDTARAVNVQARIFRWHQDVGQETYAPTDAVVVSPPILRIEPGEESLIRVVRTSGQTVRGEDSYRLLLDELPDPDQAQAGAVTLQIRQSIPVFVSPARATPAQVQWQVERFTEQINRATVGNSDSKPVIRTGYLLKATNTGDKRLRLAEVALHDANGVLLAQKRGLVGYVLGQSSVVWFIPDVAEDANPHGNVSSPGGFITLSAQSETEPIHASLPL